MSDEELTWRMETAKPEANAYRIATAAVEKAETTYERLLWRQVCQKETEKYAALVEGW